MTTADYNVLTKLCISISKIYMKKLTLHNLCHNSCVPYILFIFGHTVYSTSCAIKWFEGNELK